MYKIYPNVEANVHFPISTQVEACQVWFSRGVAWAWGFNFEEAARCFRRAIAEDPRCAIAYWGVAYAVGPNYNKAWRLFDTKDFQRTADEARVALATATSLASFASESERDLIEALGRRFPEFGVPEDPSVLDNAYAESMQKVYERHADNLNLACIYADAIMCVSPRLLWNESTGEPLGEGPAIAKTVLETALERAGGESHLGLNHLYIHLMGVSSTPEAALLAGDRLRRVAGDISHLVHMASHTDLAVGDYRRCIDSNSDAIALDDVYFAENSGLIFYHQYRAHNLYSKVFGAMMAGRFAEAESAALKLWEILPEEILRIPSPSMADWSESHLSAIAHVYIRFGEWQKILDLEMPTDTQLYCVTTAMFYYAKGVANAALNRVSEAEEMRKLFLEYAALVPESRLLLPNKEVDVMKIAAAMLDGELEYRKGNFELAFERLRDAIDFESALVRADLRPWMVPARHPYAALLLEQGHVSEAAAVYEADLGLNRSVSRNRVNPNNVWSLHGLYECLTLLGRDGEAERLRLQRDIAVSAADVPVVASCYCRLSAVENSAASEECCVTPQNEVCHSHETP